MSYLLLAAIFNIVVQLLLLLGTVRLCGSPSGWIRSVAASVISGLFSFVSMSGYFQVLNRAYWRIVVFFLVSMIAFGYKKESLRKTTVFFMLSMVLEGVCLGSGKEDPFMLLAASGCICLLCLYVSLGTADNNSSVPIQLSYAGKSVKLTALRDTGNHLRDPITGRGILIIGADVAQMLTGLTKEQLQNPADTILTCGLPGARLIPYSTIGQTGALLLAIRIQDVKIGEWRGSALVAFAPELIKTFGGHQAITGGVI